MKQHKKEMLLVEFQELSTSMRTFMGFRLTILGFSITLIGVIFSYLISSEFYEKIALEFCLLFITFALVKTMSSLTRHLIVYGLRLKEIEQKFFHNGFWGKWGDYLRVHPKDSNTKTISVLVSIINLTVFLFVLITNSILLSKVWATDHNQSNLILLLTFILITGFFYNFVTINNKLNPNNHWKEIEKTWNKLSKKSNKKKHNL